jgi:glucose/arabinose dehydrogenase/cytochrome c2
MQTRFKFKPLLLTGCGTRLSLSLGSALSIGAIAFAANSEDNGLSQQNSPGKSQTGIPTATAYSIDQAHVMADVGYHFANLWFAVGNTNWPLAQYYLGETRSHLAWAVSIHPVRKTSTGAEVDLKGILDAIDNSILSEVGKAIESKDSNKFKTTYQQALVGCYACHSACEKPFLRLQIPTAPAANIINFSDISNAPGPASQAEQPHGSTRGRVMFQQSCALCHASRLGQGNSVLTGQGPSLVGIYGRRAGLAPSFNYTRALKESDLTWNANALDRFLAGPASMVPGTSMVISIPRPEDRQDLIAYLQTLAGQGDTSQPALAQAPAGAPLAREPGDWHDDSPATKHHIDLSQLPGPYNTPSTGNGPKVVAHPANASLGVPPGFQVELFASGLSGPRLIRVAPNGDIFIAETRENRIRVLRSPDGARAPTENQVFADGLDHPFGIAFFPSGDDPQWMYVANNNSVVRLAYRNGDLKAGGARQIIIPTLAGSTGGHTTRDIAFSPDNQRMFVSIGSGSNVAEGMAKKDTGALQAWEVEHGRGAAWDFEANRAEILVSDPQGHQPLRSFATGIRNGVGLAVDPVAGELWTSTNERDGLGDDLVPDYITHVKEAGFYGWPWYYLGNHEDPRHAGERPDLAGEVLVPDVLLQAHSASLEMVFYTATNGIAAFPAEFRGDIFAAFHGSWNRSSRTGYKVVRVLREHGVATGEYEDFLTGFVVDSSSVWGRPVGVAVAHDGALLVTEDGNGTVWRVSYDGSQTPHQESRQGGVSSKVAAFKGE